MTPGPHREVVPLPSREAVTGQPVAVQRLSLAALAAEHHVPIDAVRAIRDAVREYDKAAAAARRARRARTHDVAEVAAGLTRQVDALARRLDPEDPGELLHLRDLLDAAEAIREAAMERMLDSGAGYAEVGRAIGVSRQSVREWHLRRQPEDRVG